MSSSNLVEVKIIKESVLGETPLAGDFETVRFTSESLSGTPETTESQNIRTDRMSSGQVVTGLTVGGDINFELAKDGVIDSFLESSMLNTFQPSAPVSVDLTVDATAKTVTRASGDYAVDVKVGDLVTLIGMDDAANNTQLMVAEIVSATVIRYVGKDTMVDGTGTGTSFKVADKLEIGKDKQSFSMEKQFLDLVEKFILYRGMNVGNMSLNVAYGEIINGTFNFSGNDYEAVSGVANSMTNGRTVNAAATTNSMNGSIDMPFIANSEAGSFDSSTFCIQNVELSLNNNLTPQNCIGEAAPKDYSPGTAQIEVSLGSYLADENWGLLAKKLSQAPFSIGFMVQNGDGHYGFFIPALQVSFDDPQSQGQNQDVVMNMSGVAKVGSLGESALTIFRS